MNPLPPNFFVSFEVGRALDLALPIVALESTVITHGLPHPQNLLLARDLERVVRDENATPATIAVLNGEIHIGLTAAELELLAGGLRNLEPRSPKPRLEQMLSQRGESDGSWSGKGLVKISRRDFAAAMIKKLSGGTTVAGTLFAAQCAGLKIFATGGIGGVHEVETMDISADLQALADTPIIVVCAGAKAILNLPATLEYLETMGVPVVGFQTDHFPAFYSQDSGYSVTVRLDTVEEIISFAQTHWALNMKSAILVCLPLPAAHALPSDKIAKIIHQAQQEARKEKIHGQGLTPYLLQRLNELTNGETLRANLMLLKNNAKLAGKIACLWNTRG